MRWKRFVMRALAQFWIFTDLRDGRFKLTPETSGRRQYADLLRRAGFGIDRVGQQRGPGTEVCSAWSTSR